MLIRAIAALLLGFSVAAGFHFVARLSRSYRLLGLLVSFAVVLTAPAMIPAEDRLLRLLIAGYSALLCMKMWDLHVASGRGLRTSLGDHLLFLVNVGSLVQRSRSGQRLDPRAEAKGLMVGVGAASVGVAAFFGLLALDWSSTPFLLEHGLKASAFLLIITGLFQVVAGVIRALGGHTPRPTSFPLLPASPAAFWRGLNRVVGEFLREDVFRVAGARTHPRFAVLIAFAVSGVVHEYAFSIAVGRIQGFQLAFFLIQGIAVAATLRRFPRGWVGRSSTFAFNLLTSLLFLASFEGIAPGLFFQAGVPAWIPSW